MIRAWIALIVGTVELVGWGWLLVYVVMKAGQFVMRSEYKRLPGRKSGLLRRDTLWLGSDHLLFVRSSRFTEDYRRFYLSDIQALVLQRRPAGNRRVAGLGGHRHFCAGRAALFVTDHAVWGTLLTIVAALYTWSALRREDCKTWVQTAVGTAELPSLCRTKSDYESAGDHGREGAGGAAGDGCRGIVARAGDAPPAIAVRAALALPPLTGRSRGHARAVAPCISMAFVYLLAFGVYQDAAHWGGFGRHVVGNGRGVFVVFRRWRLFLSSGMERRTFEGSARQRY